MINPQLFDKLSKERASCNSNPADHDLFVAV